MQYAMMGEDSCKILITWCYMFAHVHVNMMCACVFQRLYVFIYIILLHIVMSHWSDSNVAKGVFLPPFISYDACQEDP